MKRYCVTAKQLEEHEQKRASVLGESGLLRDKMHDIQLIYRQFESELSQQYLDGEDYLTLLAGRFRIPLICGLHRFGLMVFMVLRRKSLRCLVRYFRPANR